LQGAIQPAVVALIDEKLRIAFGFPKPSPVLVWLLNAALKTRKYFLRWIPISFMPYPTLTDTTRFESYYPKEIIIEKVGPGYLKQ